MHLPKKERIQSQKSPIHLLSEAVATTAKVIFCACLRSLIKASVFNAKVKSLQYSNVQKKTVLRQLRTP